MMNPNDDYNLDFNSSPFCDTPNNPRSLQGSRKAPRHECCPFDCDCHDDLSELDRDDEDGDLGERFRSWHGEVEDRVNRRTKAREAFGASHRSAEQEGQVTSSRASSARKSQGSSGRGFVIKLKSKNVDDLLEKFSEMFTKKFHDLIHPKKTPKRFRDIDG